MGIERRRQVEFISTAITCYWKGMNLVARDPYKYGKYVFYWFYQDAFTKLRK